MTQLSRVEISTLINWASPFHFKGLLGGIFRFYSYFKSTVCKQTLSMSEEAKQNVWVEHFEMLLNVEFDWNPDHLSNEPLLAGLPIPITIDMVKKAISKMKSGKAAGPSDIVVEMIKAAGDTGATMIRDLATAIVRDGKVPPD